MWGGVWEYVWTWWADGRIFLRLNTLGVETLAVRRGFFFLAPHRWGNHRTLGIGGRMDEVCMVTRSDLLRSWRPAQLIDDIKKGQPLLPDRVNHV